MKAEILRLLEQRQSVATLPIEPRPTGSLAPFTAFQRRWWSVAEEAGWRSVRICSVAVRVLGDLDIDLLRRSLEALLERHEALGMRPCAIEGLTWKRSDAVHDYRLDVTTVEPQPAESPEQVAARLASEFIDEKFDLLAEPLFALRLFRLGDKDHVLVMALDHMIGDGDSLQILDAELWAIYKRGMRELPLSLAPLSVQFGDYLFWQHKIHEMWLEKHGAYWKARLAGVNAITIPVDAVPEAKQSPAAIFQFKFGEWLSFRLHDVARREGTLLPVVVLVSYVCVMSRWCRTPELMVGFAAHGRDRPELQGMVGCLVEGIPLRLSIQAGDTFAELLRRICAEFHAAQNHPGFGKILELVPESRTEIYFNWTRVNWAAGTAGCEREIARDLKVKPFPVPRRPFPIADKFAPAFSWTPSGIVATVWYRPDVLRTETLEWFCRSLLLFASEFAANPQKPLSDVVCNAP